MSVKLYLPFTVTPVPNSDMQLYVFNGLRFHHTFVARGEDCDNFKDGIKDFDTILESFLFKTSEIERFGKPDPDVGYNHEIVLKGHQYDVKASAVLTARVPFEHMLEVRKLIDNGTYKNLNAFFAVAVAEKLTRMGLIDD